MEVLLSLLALGLFVGFIVFSIMTWSRFKKVKEVYAGVFTTKQVKYYVNWGMWPVLMLVGVVMAVAGLFVKEIGFLYGIIYGAVMVLAGLFFRWRCQRIYANALEACPEDLQSGLKKAIMTVSWVCQWQFAFAIFGAAAALASFNSGD